MGNLVYMLEAIITKEYCNYLRENLTFIRHFQSDMESIKAGWKTIYQFQSVQWIWHTAVTSYAFNTQQAEILINNPRTSLTLNSYSPQATYSAADGPVPHDDESSGQVSRDACQYTPPTAPGPWCWCLVPAVWTSWSKECAVPERYGCQVHGELHFVEDWATITGKTVFFKTL